MKFEEDCKEIIERYGKMWDIKPHVLAGILWWKDAMEDAYDKAKTKMLEEFNTIIKEDVTECDINSINKKLNALMEK